MIIPCPLCGERDLQEFSYRGDATKIRPNGLYTTLDAMADYVYLRDNPAGPHNELWQHSSGCHAWLVVTRDTTTHIILEVSVAQRLSFGSMAETRS